MSQLVVLGATCTCSFGAAPGTLSPTSQSSVLIEGKAAATIQDCQPSNITPFGLCSSLANPAVAAATTAALGVLTPQPCTLVPAGTWIPTKPSVLIGGKPALSKDATLMCAYMGKISVGVPGQVKATI